MRARSDSGRAQTSALVSVCHIPALFLTDHPSPQEAPGLRALRTATGSTPTLRVVLTTARRLAADATLRDLLRSATQRGRLSRVVVHAAQSCLPRHSPPPSLPTNFARLGALCQQCAPGVPLLALASAGGEAEAEGIGAALRMSRHEVLSYSVHRCVARLACTATAPPLR